MSTIENIAVNIKERIGVQHFNVLLDDAQDIYYSGKIITGKVGIIFNSPVTITSIKVLCKGEAQVHFTSRSAGFKRRFKTEEIYLHEEIDLIDANVEIKNNDFSFNLQLPEKLPCSFEGRYGRVRYSICASLNTNENLKIYSDTLPFTVAPIFDLNNHPLAPLPISENCTKTLMGHAEPFTVSVFLPVRGYVPGQTIPLKVNFKNESNVEFKKLRVVLKKVVLYRSMENVRKHKEIVVEIEQPIDKNNNVYNSEFDVPAIPPTGTICNLIDVEYKLKIEAFADINEWYYKIFYKNLKIRIDIIIGSLPLKNYEDPIDLSDDSRNSKEQSVLNVEKGDGNLLIQDDLNTKEAEYIAHRSPILMKQTKKETKKASKSFLRCTASMNLNTRMSKLLNND